MLLVLFMVSVILYLLLEKEISSPIDSDSNLLNLLREETDMSLLDSKEYADNLEKTF